MTFFTDLATLIDQLWVQSSYSENSFPEVAFKALQQLPPSEHISYMDVVNTVFQKVTLPTQLDLESRFSRPPVTVYNDHRFAIDVYFWWSGSTQIHEHAFCGAFHVLAGSSIQNTYSFEVDKVYNQHLKTGSLMTRKIQWLQAGANQKIEPGPSFIHSVFHLESPSVTVLIRTEVHRMTPQHEFWWPHISTSSFDFLTPAQKRRLQFIRSFSEANHPEACRMVSEACLKADPVALIHMLAAGRTTFRAQPRRLGMLLAELRKKHGQLIDHLIQCLKYKTRQADIIALRSTFHDQRSRLGLAILLNCHTRKEVLALAENHFSSPLQTLTTIFTQIVNARTQVDDSDTVSQVVQGILMGRTEEEISSSSPDPVQTKQVFARVRAIQSLKALFD
jgi:hypothetical protein